MLVAILGLGEVGKAIYKLCLKKHKVLSRDLNLDQLKGKHPDVLHVCIPYSVKFTNIVCQTIKELKPTLTIINSTVKPTTTRTIYKHVKKALVYSPVIGIHPHLYQYLKTFTKPIGAVTKKAYQLAKKHFNELGVRTVQFTSPEDVEAAKLLSTTYYAFNIVYEKWVHKLCQDKKLNFSQVYSLWNKNYNQGYSSTKPEYIRPVLKHMPGSIGGHCLIPNTTILNQWLKDDLTQFILSQNKKAK